jgi:hypothetical protein
MLTLMAAPRRRTSRLGANAQPRQRRPIRLGISSARTAAAMPSGPLHSLWAGTKFVAFAFGRVAAIGLLTICTFGFGAALFHVLTERKVRPSAGQRLDRPRLMVVK